MVLQEQLNNSVYIKGCFGTFGMDHDSPNIIAAKINAYLASQSVFVLMVIISVFLGRRGSESKLLNINS
jgi:hypothetical protein